MFFKIQALTSLRTGKEGSPWSRLRCSWTPRSSWSRTRCDGSGCAFRLGRAPRKRLAIATIWRPAWTAFCGRTSLPPPSSPRDAGIEPKRHAARPVPPEAALDQCPSPAKAPFRHRARRRMRHAQLKAVSPRSSHDEADPLVEHHLFALSFRKLYLSKPFAWANVTSSMGGRALIGTARLFIHIESSIQAAAVSKTLKKS